MSSNYIFSQMDIVKIVGSYGIGLTKFKDDEYHGSIPPVGNSGESLHVWPRSNTWYCNKNHVGGGILAFVQFMDKCTPREAFLKACEISQIQSGSLSDDEINKLNEQEEICNILAAAARIYHDNLTQEIYDFIFDTWGITSDSVDKWGLGYANSGRNLKGFDPKTLVKTGLVFVTETGNQGREYYQDRIIFPFFINGKVQDMTGREVKESSEQEAKTENGKKECKYKRLRLHSEKHAQISTIVGGEGFFGEDKIKKKKTCFITEGPTDCIVLNQFGFPCFAIGSTSPFEKDVPHFRNLLKGMEDVYLCLDNDKNEAGQDGILKTGQLIFNEGISTKIVVLPRESEKKIDVADFMKGKESGEFQVLVDKAPDFISYALSQGPKQSTDLIKNEINAKKFVTHRLLFSPHFDIYIKNSVKGHFGLDNDQCRKLISFVKKENKPFDYKLSPAESKARRAERLKEEKEEGEYNRLEHIILHTLEKHSKNGPWGYFACESWIKLYQIDIAKIPQQMLTLQLVDAKTRSYEHQIFMRNVSEAFRISSPDEVKEIYKRILSINNKYHKEKGRLTKVLARLQNYSPDVRDKAEKLLLEGDPQKFIQCTFQKMHVGDEALVETLPVCAASTFIIGKNSGLPVKISGDSGKGKSSGSDSFLDLLPPSMVIRGGLSDKYLYYADDLQAGSICFVDDRELSPTLQELIKTSITSFQHPEHHRTVINGEPMDLTAPERTVWVLASVDGFDDEQMSNRFLQAEIDPSRNQDHKVAQFQRESETTDIASSFQDDIEVCRCIYDLLGLRTYNIRIPFSEGVIWNHDRNRRNQPKFFNIIRSVCLYKVHQRDQVNGYYLATIEDYNRACEIYKRTTLQNNSNLTTTEQKIIDSFVRVNMAKGFYKDPRPENAARLTYERVADLVGTSKGYIKKLINGKDAQSLGLMGKVQGLGSEGSGDGKQKKLLYYTGAANFEIYEQFSSLHPEDVIVKAVSKSLQAIQQAENKEDRIVKEVFRELKDSIPSLPAVTRAIPYPKVSSIEEKNDSLLINNIIKTGSDTLKKEKDPESKNFFFSSEINKDENLEKNEEKNSCFSLIPQSQGIDSKKESIDIESPDTSPTVSQGIEGINTSPDNEAANVSSMGDTMSLNVHTRRVKEYIGTQCHGSFVIKSIEAHINDFLKLNPDLQSTPKSHLRYVFEKVSKSLPSLEKSFSPIEKVLDEEEVTLPGAKKKSPGIEMLERALQAEKGKEAGI